MLASFAGVYLSVPEAVNLYVGICFTWLGFFIFGYLQWFKLIPYLIERMSKPKTIIS